MGEEMLSKVVKDVKGIDIQTPFPRMTYVNPHHGNILQFDSIYQNH
jgi:aspartyl-tRNA synthetase